MAHVDKMITRVNELCDHINQIRKIEAKKVLDYAGTLSLLLNERDNLYTKLNGISTNYPGVTEALNKLEEV